MNPITLTNANFKQTVEQAEGVVLVDFWAPWCMPCRMVGPIVEQLAQDFAGRVTVGKLNVDDHPGVADRFHIQGIPTVGIFRGGRLVNEMVGVRPEGAYRRALETALQPPAAPATAGTKAGQHSVTVFSTPTCPWCARLKTHLREHHVAFKDVDVSRDLDAAQDMVDRSGQFGVPQAWIDGQVIVGFDRTRIDTLLGLTSDAVSA